MVNIEKNIHFQIFLNVIIFAVLTNKEST